MMDLWIGIAIVIATVLGPILAVLVTRAVDEKRERRGRQLEVFRALMRSRRSFLSADYVTALNTVEIEFAGVQSIENAQRELFSHLNLKPQQADWTDRLRRLQTRLLYAMATYLGYRMEQLDVLEGGYLPQAWGTVEEEQGALRHALLEIVAGTKRLHVEIAGPTSPPTNSISVTSSGQGSDPGPQPAIYLLHYTGQPGAAGFGLAFIGNGLISGSDLAGGHYEGNYQFDGTHLRGSVNLRVSAGTTLVTGVTANADTVIPISLVLPANFAALNPHTILVDGSPVQVSFQKIQNV
jgi:hypothetical protein